MQTFLSHGDACTKMEAEILDLVSNAPAPQDEDEPLKVFTDMLDDLGKKEPIFIHPLCDRSTNVTV